MSLKVIRVSAAAHTMLQKLSAAVMGLPIARVVEELARVEPFVFRRMIMKRMEALPASDADDGSTGGDVGSTSQPRAGSAADPDGASNDGDVRSTSQSRAGSAADPDGASNDGDVRSTSQSRAGSAADPDGASNDGDVRSTSQSRAGSAADPDGASTDGACRIHVPVACRIRRRPRWRIE